MTVKRATLTSLYELLFVSLHQMHKKVKLLLFDLVTDLSQGPACFLFGQDHSSNRRLLHYESGHFLVAQSRPNVHSRLA